MQRPRPPPAVARKLGLAPQRSSLDARLGGKLRGPGPVPGGGLATPQRTSLDGILQALQQAGSARSSLDQQAAMLQAMQAQQQLAAAGLAAGAGGLPGSAYPPGNGYAGQGGGGAGYGAPPPDAAGLHPALLSLVAAQMQGGGGAPAGPARGVPNGMHSGLGAQQGADANMAALVESLNGWQLNGGAGGGASMGHRGSMDGMTGMAGAPVSAAAAGAGRRRPRAAS